MTFRISASASEVVPFLAMAVMERAQELERAGADVVHLEVGEPDFDVPPCVQAAAERAAREGHTHYTHSLGTWELREGIAQYYAARYGVSVSPERVVVTVGREPGSVFARVDDYGRGFLVAETEANEPCLGFFGMRERALYVGGAVQVESTPGAGTRVTVRIPLAPAALAPHAPVLATAHAA